MKSNILKAVNMQQWFLLCCLFVIVYAQPSGDETTASDEEVSDICQAINCIGEEYQCIGDECYCADGYFPNQLQTRCIRCPGLGEKCMGRCCNTFDNGTLQCWQGVCRQCYDDALGKWTCRESIDQILLISSTQIVMGAALVIGIIATFILLYKLCGTSGLRPLGGRSIGDGRLSIGSLQLYVDERLRDAPPRYSRTPAAGSATYPAIAFLNAGFIHDSSIPPPPYTPAAEVKTNENQNTAVHI